MTQKATVLGASGGIGRAISDALCDRGWTTRRVTRRDDGLDWEDPGAAEAALGRLAEDGPFDLIFDATGALIIDDAGPEKKLEAIDPAAMLRQFAVNAVGPALVLKRYEKLLPVSGRSVIATLSARVGSIGDNGLGGWISYRASKAALNQIVRTAAIEIRRKRPDAICVALHPGTVRTGLSRPFVDPEQDGIFAPEEAAAKLIDVIEGLQPDQSGGLYDYAGRQIPW